MFSTCMFPIRPSVRSFVRPSVRPFVHHQSREHGILKTSELILLQIGTSGSRGKGMK